MFKIEITHNLNELIEEIKELEEQLRNLTRFWQDFVLPFLIDEVEGVFAAEPWAPLNEIYARQKALAFPGKTILRRTDTLFESLTEQNAPYSVQDARRDRFIYGTDVPYAYFHEFGITPPQNWGELPKRSVLENLPNDLENQVGYQLETYIDELLADFN